MKTKSKKQTATNNSRGGKIEGKLEATDGKFKS